MDERILTQQNGAHSDMMMDISVLDLKAGDIKEFYSETDEMAILLIKGEVTFAWPNNREKVSRSDCFKEVGYCLHIPKGTEAVVEAHGDAEVLVQKTANEGTFAPVFYTPETASDETFGAGFLGGTCVRCVRTYFDYNNAPYSNMVIGEVLSEQGGWTSYLPHSHPQPEVYYYRFDHPNGFGASFVGERAYKVNDKDFCAIPGGEMHPQATAPGYRMYYVWMIRHLDGNPWTDREFDPKHVWLLEE